MAYLLVIGDRDALRRILASERMAFPPGRATAAQRLRPGDRLAAFRQDVELAGVREELDAFRGRDPWSWLLRRPLLELTAADDRLLRRSLRPLVTPAFAASV